MRTAYTLCLLAFIGCDDGTNVNAVDIDQGAADAAPDVDAVDIDLGPADATPDVDAVNIDHGLDVDAVHIDATPDVDAVDIDLGAADVTPDVDVVDIDFAVDPLGMTWAHGQARGTHNSTHVEPAVPVHPSHRYTHAALSVQLGEQGVRQFELDVHHHVDGHFEVFHLPVVDAETVCQRLSDCLDELKAWSDANPRHFPVMVWIEPKDELDFVPPYDRIAPEHFDDLDAELRAGLGARLFTPDELRGAHDTLAEAVAEGWPELNAMRGRYVFAMLDGGAHRDHYLDGHPVLEGRAMFVTSDADDPFAAVMKINDAVGNAERVGELARQGFVITSNVDSAEDDDGRNAERRDGSLAAGAHFLSSDFPAPVDDREYWLEVPGGDPVRCNPVTAPEGCDATVLE